MAKETVGKNNNKKEQKTTGKTTNSTRRSNSATIPITVSLFDHLTAIVNKVIDVFTGNSGYQQFLATKGAINSELYAALMKKKFEMRSDISIILDEVIMDIITTRENRLKFYISQIEQFRYKLQSIRTNSERYAINEIKSKRKSMRKLYKIKFGLFKSFKMTREYSLNNNIEEKYNELVDYYFNLSNYQILEKMINELRTSYEYEEYFFIMCLKRLYKKYNSKLSDIFAKNNYSRHIIQFPIVKSGVS
jgi:hypothetical protein